MTRYVYSELRAEDSDHYSRGVADGLTKGLKALEEMQGELKKLISWMTASKNLIRELAPRNLQVDITGGEGVVELVSWWGGRQLYATNYRYCDLPQHPRQELEGFVKDSWHKLENLIVNYWGCDRKDLMPITQMRYAIDAWWKVEFPDGIPGGTPTARCEDCGNWLEESEAGICYHCWVRRGRPTGGSNDREVVGAAGYTEL